MNKGQHSLKVLKNKKSVQHGYKLLIIVMVLSNFSLFGCVFFNKKDPDLTPITDASALDVVPSETLLTVASLIRVVYDPDAEKAKDALASRTAVQAALAKYPDLKNYKLIWSGFFDTQHLSFVIQHKTDSKKLYLTHRGTLPNFENIWEDIDVLRMIAYPPEVSGSKVSEGLHTSLGYFRSMRSIHIGTSDTAEISFTELLEKLLKNNTTNSPLSLSIIGHSLGGSVSTISSIDIRKMMISRGYSSNDFSIDVFAIASQTVGNKAFSDYYDRQVELSEISSRYHISQPYDVVPKLVVELRDLPDALNYTFSTLGSVTKLALKSLAVLANSKIKSENYSKIKKEVIFNTDPVPTQCSSAITSFSDFYCWLKAHHTDKKYQNLITDYVNKRTQ